MKKLLSTTIAVGLLSSMSITPVFADVAATALPSLKNANNATVTTDNAKMNIQIQGGQHGVGTLNWNSYNIGKDAHVNYEFTAHNQTALNKVDAAGGLSQIYGKITDSGCFGCGYSGTGKIVLINPNGVLFGDGANVDVNSFTVSTMNGVFNQDTNKLQLTKDANQKDFGIVVEKGANIYGDKNVAFASNNITVYNGSQIATNLGNNVDNTAYGKVKLVTADGVTFQYYNNGAVDQILDPVVSTDKLYLSVNGDIKSGNIDLRNYSTNDGSEINLNGATLKAVKAVKGNDGNIWLTSLNKIVTEKSKFTTENMEGAEDRNGGNVVFLAGKKVSVGTDDIDAVGNVNLTSQNHDVVVGKQSTIDTAKDVNITAGRYASVQENSTINAKNVNIKGSDVYLTDNNINATEKITGEATTGDIGMDKANLKANEINLKAANNIYGNADVNNNLTKLNAGNDIDVVLANVANKDKGLVAEAGKNVTIETDGTLSVSSIISRDGDVTLTADKVIAGLPYTTNPKIPGDNSPRSYIYVKNGTFTSNTPDDPFAVTASDTITPDGKYQERHHIQYGNGTEKILLINDRPYVKPQPPEPEPEQPDTNPQSMDDDQAAMLNRIPRQPEVFNNNTNIADTRTTFVDVFAAASQIEIEDDEE
ncbi:filamentous hemagglutinin N-terminal domain-containing protein [bacterium]|nr:filamentous hemagglutinin N-terminal domain-containing protein [bacterium]